jgi:CBS domain-containing protein
MSYEYSALTSYPLKSGAGFVHPSQEFQEKVTLDDPALSVMTDLKKISVVTVRAMTALGDAHNKMKRYGVRTLLVLDASDRVQGLLTATDILGEKPMRFLKTMGGTHADIMVRDIMTPQPQLEVLKMQDVVSSKVGQVLATLKAAGRQHAMVARQLGVEIHIAEVARSFADIEAALVDLSLA